MAAQHTPGPWSLVETPHEKIISSWHIHVGDYQIAVHPYKRIYSEDRTQSGLVVDQEHMADARLIAAAPELLEALRVFVSCQFPVSTEIDERGHSWSRAYLDQALPIARAAIAKATGGAA